MTRNYSGIVTGLVLSEVVAGTVFAEGSWTSSMSNVKVGFDSRTWTDRNSDSASTAIRFEGCRDENYSNGSNDWTTVSVQRHNGILPAGDFGRETLYCHVADTGYWGDQPAQDYHFQIEAFSGGTFSTNALDVPYLKASY
ncbi:hypothetical protein BH20CHL6_BH20CHL6_09640 [soil metagenome]